MTINLLASLLKSKFTKINKILIKLIFENTESKGQIPVFYDTDNLLNKFAAHYVHQKSPINF